ncbi:unnamed protein product [Brassica oleracea]
MTKEEQEKELLKLGLPIVGGLSCEFSNVKKAASVDHATVDATCSGLEVRAIRREKVDCTVCYEESAGEEYSEFRVAFKTENRL